MHAPRLRLRILEDVLRKEPRDMDDRFRARFSGYNTANISTWDWEKGGRNPTVVIPPPRSNSSQQV